MPPVERAKPSGQALAYRSRTQFSFCLALSRRPFTLSMTPFLAFSIDSCLIESRSAAAFTIAAAMCDRAHSPQRMNFLQRFQDRVSSERQFPADQRLHSNSQSVRAMFVRQKSAVKTGALQIPDQWSGESHPGGEVLATFQAAYVASMHYTGLKTRALFSGAIQPFSPAAQCMTEM